MQSMTGFGRSQHSTELFLVEVEISSVNRKQAEIAINLPRGFSELETEIRKSALNKISRGRLNISVKISPLDASASSLQIDTVRAQALKNAFDQLGQTLDQDFQLTPADFLRLPDLFLENRTLDLEKVAAAVRPALEQALEQLISMRKAEGADLATDFQQRLQTLQTLTSHISLLAPTIPSRQRELLHQRLADAGLNIDDNDERVAKEIALFADRCDISEELTRLDSHFKKFATLLNSDKPVGRSLDFLCQELNREFNTIGSKANNSEVAHHVVSLKTELEKIREQVQNVE